MATNMNTALPAHSLLDLFRGMPGAPPPSDADTDRTVTDFIDHLVAIRDSRKTKQWSERYLIDGVFSRVRKFNSDAECQIYCRIHLRVAIEQLRALIDELRDAQTGTLSFSAVQPWEATITDYIFDLASIVPYLQRKVPGYIYLRGGKNPTVHSWEVYQLAKGLAYQSSHWGRGSALDHKAAQIAAIGVLRQALELRFTRLIAVYPTDKKGKSPKLRHGFHQDFVVDNPAIFQAKGFSISDLRPMYDWCSEIVHQAYQPYAWQSSWALLLAGRLLGSRAAPQNTAWSIANAVEIDDISAMQTKFEEHFLANYDHGAWQMSRERPEALTPSWKPEMGGTSPGYRVPFNRKQGWMGWIQRLLSAL